VRNAFARILVTIPAGAAMVPRKPRYYCNCHASANAQSFMADAFDWTGVASDHIPTPPTTSIAFSTPMANVTEGAYSEINLSNVVGASLRNGAAPAGLNAIEVGAQGNATRMQVIVTYTL
jgi:hypothetical protein